MLFFTAKLTLALNKTLLRSMVVTMAATTFFCGINYPSRNEKIKKPISDIQNC